MHDRNVKVRGESDRQRRGPEEQGVIRESLSRSWHDTNAGKATADRLSSQCISESRSSIHEIDEPARQQIIQLVLRLFLGKDTNHHRSVVFAGIEQYCATPLITAWTGEMLADLSRSTICLVDADLRSPSLHECFSIPNENGLAELVRSSSTALYEFAQRISPTVWVLTAGIASVSQARLTPNEIIRRTFAMIREQFQYVLISAPPICTSVEAVTIGNCCDGVVMIVEQETKKVTALNARALLEAGGARLLGAIMHDRQFPLPVNSQH